MLDLKEVTKQLQSQINSKLKDLTEEEKKLINSMVTQLKKSSPGLVEFPEFDMVFNSPFDSKSTTEPEKGESPKNHSDIEGKYTVYDNKLYLISDTIKLTDGSVVAVKLASITDSIQNNLQQTPFTITVSHEDATSGIVDFTLS